ncbi:hypothetical protein CYMTET_3220 [Cymbomonas tetramitiformis]|uniref:Endonuclease/exonuclease/phosphatase domain-containing protein n=1 Tax=Cymbomonas tetramitiformis TaxID=36881 RepID=A0AAE0LL20_9CHLO|nr:hypothetical protein CYMTET_3220 [Cymbomonas tetramitiformis]
MEAGTPGEVVIIEPVRPNESDATPREATGDIQPTRQGKQKGLHDTFLHELKKGKAKRTMEEIPNTKQQERETSRHERTGIQTDLRMYMNPAGEVRRKPRKDGGPDEPMPEREPEEENVDPRTAASEEGGRMKDANGDMAHRSEKLRMQMPITEKWEETTVLTEPERYKLNALTWNIQGNGEALYDLEPALEEWDINLAILTEIKSASKNVQQKCNARHSTAYCTDVPMENLRRHRKKAMYRGGVGIILRGGLAHKHAHTEVEVPGLRGYVAHVVLHLPGDKHIHVLGIYNPPDSEEVETRRRIKGYVRMIVTRAREENEMLLIGGDLNAARGQKEKGEDKAWTEMMEREDIVDIGGKRDTTLRRHDGRNIDRWMTLREDEEKYGTLNERELTTHHASDHRMIATTGLELYKCNTHLPRWEDEEKGTHLRLDLPLTGAQVTTLRRHLESGYFAERVGLEREIEQLRSAKVEEKSRAIDRAGEEMAKALKRMATEAMRKGESQRELTLKGRGKPERKEEAMGQGLRLPRRR